MNDWIELEVQRLKEQEALVKSGRFVILKYKQPAWVHNIPYLTLFNYKLSTRIN